MFAAPALVHTHPQECRDGGALIRAKPRTGSGGRLVEGSRQTRVNVATMAPIPIAMP